MEKMQEVPAGGNAEYAGFWVRFIAACIDLLVYAPVFVGLRYGLDRIAHASGAVDASVDYISAQILPSTTYQWTVEGVFDVLALLTYAWFLSCRWQGSPGMYVMKFHIGDKDGKRIGFLRAFMWCLTAVIGWLLCFAGVLYMQKDIFIVKDMLVSCNDQKVDIPDCIPEIEKVIGIPFASYEQLIFAAAGLAVFLYLIWALSIALPKDKTGFHNLLCGTRF
jgi:uncharacterized RDD family membrane protein YckC